MIRSRAAREKAQAIIQMYNIAEPPIDINYIARKLGFEVLPFDFPETISAVIKIKDLKKIIGVNKKHALTRQRFSIAHELGHYLSGHEDHDSENTFIDREKKYLNRSHRMEEEADEFAAELLMPEGMLKKDFTNGEKNAATLSFKYQVSEQAMLIQLVNLKLLT